MLTVLNTHPTMVSRRGGRSKAAAAKDDSEEEDEEEEEEQEDEPTPKVPAVLHGSLLKECWGTYELPEI